jgi:hypothetical protein
MKRVHLVPLTPAPLPKKIAKVLNDLDDISKVVKRESAIQGGM